jgi:uncharacterized membrane protein
MVEPVLHAHTRPARRDHPLNKGNRTVLAALFSTGQTIALAVLPLVYMLFWTAVRSPDPAKREAALRLLAMLWRHKGVTHAEARQTDTAAAVTQRKRRRRRSLGG